MTATIEPALADIHTRLLKRIADEKRPEIYVLVSSAKQVMQVCVDGRVLKKYQVSTAANGLGGQCGSFKTPSGLLQIADKIGGQAASGLLFKSRLALPLCASIEARPVSTGVDTITSRILRLDGLEEGINTGEGCDAFERYIYIHGTAEEGLLGQPVSHGCIRMGNDDVIALFSDLEEGALVFVF